MKPVDEWKAEDIIEIEFDNTDMVEQFYLKYSEEMGFGIRQDDKRFRVDGTVFCQKWVWCKDGWKSVKNVHREVRKRKPRRVTRCGCEACITVNFDDVLMMYVVTYFKEEHNHTLGGKEDNHFMRSHRKILEVDKEQVIEIKKVGIKTSQIMNYMVTRFSGHQFVGYKEKDLYNFVESDRREQILETDAETMIAHMRSKVEYDPYLFCRYAVDDENRLCHIFWADEGIRRDYTCFGDVIVFDSTYKSNEYKMPYVLILGVNHHFKTTIFRAGLISSESEETYKWLLKTFVLCMGGRTPLSVLTDSCPWIKVIVSEVFPEAKHRLCSSHVEGNCKRNVGDNEFFGKFGYFVNGVEDPHEFESEWERAMGEFGLLETEWLKDMYKKGICGQRRI